MSVFTDSFQTLVSEFGCKVAELRLLSNIRVQEQTQHAVQSELLGLEANVKAIETQLAALKLYISKELASIPKAQALIESCKQQRIRLEQISGNLPTHLPSLSQHSYQAPLLSSAVQQDNRLKDIPNLDNIKTKHAQTKSETAVAKCPSVPPRRFLTQAEFAKISSYTRGHLTVDKVNASLEEVVGHAEAHYRTLNALKSQQLPKSERKRALELAHSIAAAPAVRGHWFFLEADLKAGSALKLDKSGKMVITVLRQAGRLQEVRIPLSDQAAAVVYLLLSE